MTQAAALRGERNGLVTQQVHGSMVLQCIFVHSDWITDNANRMCFFLLKLACASACDFCVTHTHHAPHTHSDTSSASAGDFCITHMNHVPHTHSDTSSASAGDFCITLHTHSDTSKLYIFLKVMERNKHDSLLHGMS